MIGFHRLVALSVGVSLLAVGTGVTCAQSYPNRLVRMSWKDMP
jgi:hypothetical protein